MDELQIPQHNEQSLDIQDGQHIKINPNFVINLSSDEKKSSLESKREACKVLRFLPGWTFKNVMSEIVKLNPNHCKSLFVFIINVKEINEGEKLMQAESIKECLEKVFHRFCITRQIIIQLVSENDKKTNIFYNRNYFMKELYEVKIEADAPKFSSFLHKFLRLKCQSLEEYQDAIFDMLKKPNMLTLRFLQIFDFSTKFFFRIATHCAANLSKDHFVTSLGASHRVDVGINSKMIVLYYNDQKYKSILEAAICNENGETFNYLKKSCAVLIKRLPLEHQIEISNQLAENKKYGQLCDLLKYHDFPFPSDIKSIHNESFEKIVTERNEFHEAIENENVEKINQFIKLNSNLHIVYGTNNKSALFTALEADKVNVFLLLKEKLRGFDFQDLKRKLFNQNIETSSSVMSKPVYLLTTRSKIFSKKKMKLHRGIIKKWFSAIRKTEFGGPLINAAAQCEHLQIIFDFGRKDVAGVDLDSTDADGIAYIERKLIIIAAKYSSKEDRQKIKGSLAHELAHYVIGMVFANNEQPYLNESDPRCQKFKKIIEKYSYLKDGDEDDGCDKIISLVYTNYKEKDCDAELAVRFFQILARYDDDETKRKQLIKSFGDLYDFTKTDLIPGVEKFNLRNIEIVEIFNKYTGLYSFIRDIDLKFPVSNTIKNLLNKNLIVVTTNIPKLFLVEIYNHLTDIHGNLVKSKNIFVSDGKLVDKELAEDFKNILLKIEDVNIFADFCSGNFQVLQNFEVPEDRCFIFVVSNESQSKELLQVLKNKCTKMEKVEYKWSNFVPSVRASLLQYKVNFQNNIKISLCDLIGSERDLTAAINSDILNMMLNKLEVTVNSDIGLAENVHFKHLFHERRLIKGNEEMSQADFIQQVGDMKYVLISDVAGNGKSWVMRNLAIELARQRPSSWMTFVDLKSFIPYFLSKKDSSFSDFMMNELLKHLRKLEVEIFTAKYKAGQALIFFDGFDEIAPNCAEFVVKLMKSFEWNGGNQLFVSTRDYFTVELRDKLNVKSPYKLVTFENRKGVELIAKIWRLHDLRDKIGIDHEKDIVESREYKTYIKHAEEIVNQLPNLWSGVGLPQIFSMIGKITKEKKKLDESLNTYQLYKRMRDISFEEWYNEKGQLRKDLHLKSQEMELNSLKLHELKAMQSFAPGKEKYCDLMPGDQWKNIYLIGCGLMTQKGEEFVFIHETFQEFFVAEFIVRNLKNLKRIEEAFEFLQEVLIDENKNVIRKFLDEAIANERLEIKETNNLFGGNIFDENYENRIELLANRSFDHFKNIHIYNLLTKNPFLGRFLIEILKKVNAENLIKIIAEEVVEMISSKVSRNSQQIIVDLIISSIDAETIDTVVEKVNEMTVPTFIEDVLNFKNVDNENIFWALANSDICCKDEKFEKFVSFLKRFMSVSEILEKMKECKSNGETIFHHFCTKKEAKNDLSKLEIFWKGFVNFFQSESTLDDFKSFIERDLYKSFGDKRAILIDMILELTQNGLSSLQKIALSKLQNKLRETFDQESSLPKLINYERSPWTKIRYSYKIERHIDQWEFLQNAADSLADLLEIFIESDCYGNSLIHHLVKYSTWEIFNFYFRKMEKHLSTDHIKKLLSILNKFGQSFLHFAAAFNESVELHENLWKILIVYFEEPEIVNLVKHRDIFGCSYINFHMWKEEVTALAANETTEKIYSEKLPCEKFIKKKILKNGNFDYIRSTLEKVCPELDTDTLKVIFNFNCECGRNLLQFLVHEGVKCSVYEYLCNLLRSRFNFDSLCRFLRHKDNSGNSLLLTVNKFGTSEIAKKTWIMFERMPQDVKNQLADIVLDQNIAGCIAENCHERFWRILLSVYEDQTRLKDFLMRREEKVEKNFLQVLIVNNKSDKIIEFTFETLKAKFSEDEFYEILFAENSNFYRSQLSEVLKHSDDLEKFQNKWQLVKIFNDPQQIILEVDSLGRNIFHYAAESKSPEILSFFCEQLKKLNIDTEIKKALLKRDSEEHNFLTLAAYLNTNKASHEILWNLAKTFLDESEVWLLIIQASKNRENVLQAAVRWNTVDVAEFILSEIKAFLRLEDWFEKGLLQFASENEKDRKGMKELVKKLVN